MIISVYMYDKWEAMDSAYMYELGMCFVSTFEHTFLTGHAHECRHRTGLRLKVFAGLGCDFRETHVYTRVLLNRWMHGP